MAIFKTHATVITSDHPLMKAYDAGIIANPPGRVLSELLKATGGVYEVTLTIPPHTLEQMKRVAAMTADAHLLEISRQPEISISIEHLRGASPDARVSIGGELTYEPGEADRLGINRPRLSGPRNSSAENGE